MGVLFLYPHNSTHCSKEISCNNRFDKPSTTIWHLKWGNTAIPFRCWCTSMGTTKHCLSSNGKSAFSSSQSIFRLNVFRLLMEICSKMGKVVILLNFPWMSSVSISFERCYATAFYWICLICVIDIFFVIGHSPFSFKSLVNLNGWKPNLIYFPCHITISVIPLFLKRNTNKSPLSIGVVWRLESVRCGTLFQGWLSNYPHFVCHISTQWRSVWGKELNLNMFFVIGIEHYWMLYCQLCELYKKEKLK